MVLFLGMMFLAVLGGAICPDTPLGRYLRRAMIEAPAKALTHSGLLKAAGVVLAVGFLLATPEFAVLFAFTDLAFLMEIAAAASLLGLANRGRSLVILASAIVRRSWQTAAAWRTRKTSRRRSRGARPGRRAPPPRDPEPGWGYAFA